MKGPRFIAAKSGSIIPETGHIACLFVKKCEEMQALPLGDKEAMVTIVKLGAVEPQSKPRLKSTSSGLLAIIPIAVSLGTCAVCHGGAHNFIRNRVWRGPATISVPGA
jgi:hypothetical protein